MATAALVITLAGGVQAASDQGVANRSDKALERTSTPNHGTESAAAHANLDAVPDGAGFLGFTPDVASALPAGWCGCHVEGVYTGNDPYDMIEEHCNPGFVPDAKLRTQTNDNSVCVFSRN